MMKRWRGRWMTWDYDREQGWDYTGHYVKFWYKRKPEWRDNNWPPKKHHETVTSHQVMLSLYAPEVVDPQRVTYRTILNLNFEIRLPRRGR